MIRVRVWPGLFVAGWLGLPTNGVAQGNGVVELHARAAAVGIVLTAPTRQAWTGGVDLSIGNHMGVDLNDEGAGVDTFGNLSLLVRWASAAWQVTLRPVGVAAVLGNDFGAFYPSAGGGASRFWGRIGVGTEVTVVRIAGGFGTGHYWVEWTPVRVALRM